MVRATRNVDRRTSKKVADTTKDRAFQEENPFKITAESLIDKNKIKYIEGAEKLTEYDRATNLGGTIIDEADEFRLDSEVQRISCKVIEEESMDFAND